MWNASYIILYDSLEIVLMPILYLARELQSVDTEYLLEQLKNAICVINDNQEKLLKLAQFPFNKCILHKFWWICNIWSDGKLYNLIVTNTHICQNTHDLIITWRRGQEKLDVYQYLLSEKLNFENKRGTHNITCKEKLCKINLHKIRWEGYVVSFLLWFSTG